MKETTPAAMSPCASKVVSTVWWVLEKSTQKNRIPPLFCWITRGKRKEKHITNIANNSIGVVYNRLHHFIADSPWEASQINQRSLEIINKRSQTKFKKGFSLILDNSGHRKSGCDRALGSLRLASAPSSGNFTSGVGQQYIRPLRKRGSRE